MTSAVSAIFCLSLFMKIVINTVICTNVYGTFNDLKCSVYLNLALVLYNSFLEASEVSGSE